MRKAQRWRYYCDFCKKSSGGMDGMEIHERHCTANPQRQCRVCKNAVGPIEIGNQVRSMLGTQRAAELLVKIRELCRNCPACILAVIRQNNLGYSVEPWFDYKKEMELRWKASEGETFDEWLAEERMNLEQS
jgi:hypothetical protein